MCDFCHMIPPLFCDECGRGVCFDFPRNHAHHAIALPDGNVVCNACVDLEECARSLKQFDQIREHFIACGNQDGIESADRVIEHLRYVLGMEATT
jgi:hypothetical protein